MAFERLRHQWSEISLEKKLAMFVAPVFVAVMSGIIVSFATGAFRTSNDSQPPAPGSASTVESAGGLEVVDVEVTSGVPANDPGDPAVPPVIDVTVRNTGRDVSVITGANLRVRELAWIEVCEGGAGLDPSVEYDVILPASAAGEVVEADVSQQVPANTADRFTLRLYTPEENRGDGTRLYQLDVELEHDATARPLEAGTVVVAVPFDPDSNLLSVATELPEEEQPADLRACYDANKARFLDFLELEGERSPELTAELAD